MDDSRHEPGPGKVHPKLRAFVTEVLGRAAKLAHRPTLEGIENLPDGPFLLVANHGAGIAISELTCFSALYLEQVGHEKKLAGFAHPIAFMFPGFRDVMRNLGAVPSTYESGYETLASGVPMLVFPGGDHETLRPVWEHDLVDFGGRKGFLRMARKANVPIVPMGIRGSHLTVPILLRSRHVLPKLLVLPRLVGLKRFALTALGVAGAVAIVTRPWRPWVKGVATWAWLTSPFVFLPVVPATIRFRIGEPISPEELFGEDREAEEATDGVLERALARVQGAVQGLVTALGE